MLIFSNHKAREESLSFRKRDDPLPLKFLGVMMKGVAVGLHAIASDDNIFEAWIRGLVGTEMLLLSFM